MMERVLLLSCVRHAIAPAPPPTTTPLQIEVPIPEQFVSRITPDGKLASGVSDLYTH